MERQVVFDYLDHRDQQHKSMPCETESFIKRLVQHIPDKGFRMIRYYGFACQMPAIQIVANRL